MYGDPNTTNNSDFIRPRLLPLAEGKNQSTLLFALIPIGSFEEILDEDWFPE
ncbi:hypothetical protein NIES25_29950 [Nostoc linckia NIES-25]|nr:hypothetical protein NIES25_29950 [Nostoc linckia NIES-25]